MKEIRHFCANSQHTHTHTQTSMNDINSSFNIKDKNNSKKYLEKTKSKRIKVSKTNIIFIFKKYSSQQHHN